MFVRVFRPLLMHVSDPAIYQVNNKRNDAKDTKHHRNKAALIRHKLVHEYHYRLSGLVCTDAYLSIINLLSVSFRV